MDFLLHTTDGKLMHGWYLYLLDYILRLRVYIFLGAYYEIHLILSILNYLKKYQHM